MKRFLSGDEALAEGVRLARPQVIAAYPITPQTVVVERLSEMVESGQLAAEYVHVESEHSALSCAMGASATGARTFTATSSQGLLYMAEVLTYAAGGRFPIVMMNANRSTSTATSATRWRCSTTAGSRPTPRATRRRLIWRSWPTRWPRIRASARRSW